MSTLNGIPVVDTDTHITEPPDLWTSRMSRRKWGDLIPHVRYTDDTKREQWWFIGDKRASGQVAYSNFGRGADGSPVRVAGGSGGADTPKSFDTVHPSAFDAHERLKVMDASGIDVAALYPNLSFFGYEGFYKSVKSEEFQLDCVRAYNDFIDDFTSAAPHRFIKLAVIPYWDIAETVKEIERCAEMGFKGLVTTAAPHLHGQPYMADRHWDPIWDAATAAKLPVSFHAGGGDLSAHINAEREEVEGYSTSHARLTTAVFLDNAHQLVDLLNSGVLPRHPELKFISVESGMGWVPFVLDSVDYHFEKLALSREKPEFKAKPSDYFRNQVYVNYWFEKLDPYHLEHVGVGNLLFETDFPHATCIAFEEVGRTIDSGMGHVDRDIQERILWRNAAELYNLDLSFATGA
jgi:predicted TIM-barrel fold metal-dependent hydrolase